MDKCTLYNNFQMNCGIFLLVLNELWFKKVSCREYLKVTKAVIIINLYSLCFSSICLIWIAFSVRDNVCIITPVRVTGKHALMNLWNDWRKKYLISFNLKGQKWFGFDFNTHCFWNNFCDAKCIHNSCENFLTNWNFVSKILITLDKKLVFVIFTKWSI